MLQDAYVAFIDFTAAFDNVSHKFLDRSLKQMGASDSSREPFFEQYIKSRKVLSGFVIPIAHTLILMHSRFAEVLFKVISSVHIVLSWH